MSMDRCEKIKILNDFCDEWGTCSDGCPINNIGRIPHSCNLDLMSNNELDWYIGKIGATNAKEQIVNPSDTKPDMVSHPSHYNQGNVECIDAMAAATVNKQGIEAICVSNVIKYLFRYETKNGLEDVRKAAWYLNRLIKELEDKA